MRPEGVPAHNENVFSAKGCGLASGRRVAARRLGPREDGGLRALAQRDFRRVWSAFQVAQLGFWISQVGLQWTMTRLAPGEPRWLGRLFFFSFIPILLLSPVAGAVGDRRSRRAVLQAAYGLSAAAAAALAVLAHQGRLTPPLVLLLALVLGVGLAFTAPTGQALVAGLVSADDLASAVSLHSVGLNASRIAGPALAVPLLAQWGGAGAFGAYAVALVVVMLLLSRIRLAPAPPPALAQSLGAGMRDGLRHVRERPPAGLALVTMSVLSLLVLPYVALLPVFALRRLGGDESTFALLLMATGAGAVCGALATASRRTPPTLRNAARFCAGLSVALAGFALSVWVPLSLVLVALAGFCSYGASTTLNTLLQNLTDDERRARVMGLFILCWGGLIPIGGLWMGAAAERFGPAAVVVGGAAAGGVYALWLLRRGAVSPPA